MKNIFPLLLAAMLSSYCGMHPSIGSELNTDSSPSEQEESNEKNNKGKKIALIAGGAVVTTVAVACLVPGIRKPCHNLLQKFGQRNWKKALPPDEIMRDAIDSGNVKEVENLLNKKGFDPESVLPSNRTPLEQTIFAKLRAEDPEDNIKPEDIDRIFETLLAKKVNLNNKERTLPLELILNKVMEDKAGKKQKELLGIMEKLIANGADPNLLPNRVIEEAIKKGESTDNAIKALKGYDVENKNLPEKIKEKFVEITNG